MIAIDSELICASENEELVQVQGGFEYNGSFYKITNNDNLFIRNKLSEELKKSSMIVQRKKLGELNDRKHRCGASDLNFNQKQQKGTVEIKKAFKAEEVQKAARGKIISVSKKEKDLAIREADVACPVKPQRLTVAVVADCNYVKVLGGKKKARENILNDLNMVSGIFSKTFNLDLSVNSIELLEKCEGGDSFNVPCKKYPGLDRALNRFSKWRDDRSSDAGIYHLVTACNYSDTVGLAWVNQVCRSTSFTDSQADVVSGTSMSVLVDNQFSVMAHEMAHNLGAIHDCGRSNCDGSCKGYLECQCCPCEGCDCKAQYIMDALSGGFGALEFSSCSIKDVCDKLPYLGSCIKEQPEMGTDLRAVCGNGIREGNEECDCGTAEQCSKTKCCTPDCKLTAGSQCYDENDRCCRDCQVISSESREVCRVSSSFCLEDSYCDGVSSSCPASKMKADGISCSDEGGRCAFGICTSRNAQCGIFGRHLNLTESCQYTKRSCSVICQGPDQCVDMNANYIDGTPCGDKGFCYGGMCSEFGSGAPSAGKCAFFRSPLTFS